MTASNSRWSGLLVAIAFALAGGCSKEQPKPAAQSVPAPAGQPATAPAAAAPGSPALASAQFTNDPELRCELLEVKRVSGGALLVRWRTVNTANPSAAKPKSIQYDASYWRELYYIDPAENKKYTYLQDSEGNGILSGAQGYFNAGEQRLSWAKFPAPPPGSNKIALHIPYFMPFEDIPVAQ